MSPWLVVLIIAAVVLVGLGLQVSAHQIQRFPVDNRAPGSLVDTRRSRSFTMRPSELEQLHSIVAESLSSEAVADAKLYPMLAQLEADAPGRTGTEERAASAGGRRRSRARGLTRRLVQLEHRWGVTDS